MVKTNIQLSDLSVEVVLKDIKNIHLSVYPPNGRVRISAPLYMNINTIRVYAISKLDWIRQQQNKFQAQQRETPREYLERESHYVWGTRYLLYIVESDQLPFIDLSHHQMLLNVRPGADQEKKKAIVEEWYRGELRQSAQELFAKWEPQMGVKVERLFVQRMKTRWGSCNPQKGSIRLNTDLAKKPRECLEYVVIHEMAHLLEPTHNAHFVALMDRFMPNWKHYKEELNREPLSHVTWEY